MPRRHQGRRRRRPGRRRPGRPPRRLASPTPRGFTASGMGLIYDLAMPTLRGRAKKAWFNGLCAYILAGGALGGAVVGHACLGPPGAILGLLPGLLLGGRFAEVSRTYRR